VPAPTIQILINVYYGNFIHVQWGDIVVWFADHSYGCFMSDNIVEALIYADDIVLQAPLASALRTMCDNYPVIILFHLMPVNLNV